MNTKQKLDYLKSELKSLGVEFYDVDEIEKAGYLVEVNKRGKLSRITPKPSDKPEKEGKDETPKATKLQKVVEAIQTNLLNDYGINANISLNGNIRSLNIVKRVAKPEPEKK